MKIFIFSPRLPRKYGKADSFTIYHFVRFLHGRGHDIVLMSFFDPVEESEADLAELNRYCSRVEVASFDVWKARLRTVAGLFRDRPLQVSYFYDAAMQALLDRVLAEEQPDVLYVQYFRSAEYVKETPFPKVLSLQPSQILNLRRMKAHTTQLRYKLLYLIEYAKVKRYEPAVLSHFDISYVISEHDRRAIDPEGRIPSLMCRPHGIDVAYFQPTGQVEKEDDTVIFIADLEVPTNQDAMIFYRTQILPLLYAKKPSLKTLIVGRKPPEWMRAWPEEDANLVVTGFVEDVRPYLERARVSIDPLRIGAGMQNKILTSMCMSLPVVSTTIANEGIGAVDGEQIMLADTPGAFADQVLGLLRDEALARRIGQNGRRFVEEGWTWEYHFEKVEAQLIELARREPRMAMPALS